jgi:hypothetical protein
MIVKTITPGLFNNSELCDLEVKSGLPLRLAYIGLWTTSDDNGVFPWDAELLKDRITPRDDISFEDVLSVLLGAGHIVRYGEHHGRIPPLSEKTTIDGAASRR